MGRLADWIDHRAGHRAALRAAFGRPLAGGPSFAYVFGSVLAFVLLLQITTGVLLATVYSPSATDAWASVAYIQDQVALGWFVRGLHSHGASAIVILAGLHLLQTALYGAYKKPRELTWIVGVLMLGVLLGFALTGYLLPWDETGYRATQVATGIAGSTPLVGDQVKELAQGGNEYGNLTLTRFFALHVLILPGALLTLLAVHLALFRRHGPTPHWRQDAAGLERRARPYWPDQSARDMAAAALVFAILVIAVLHTGGVGLGAPADPSSAFEARPEWYFRPLFQALKYFSGPLETVVALGAPAVLGGFLLALPFLDRGPERRPAARWKLLTALGLVVAAAAGLTIVSMREDAGDAHFQQAIERAETRARRARTLALEHGVPVAGGAAVFTMEPFAAVRRVWHGTCAGCHAGPERSGPEIAPGYNSRAWIRDFLRAPDSKRFFGLTKISGMPAVTLTGGDLDALVELVYAESGAADVDRELALRARPLWDGAAECGTCHSLDGKTTGGVGPNLGGRGSPDTLARFIARPDHPLWFGDESEMPAFYDELDRSMRQELAAYLVRLRGMPAAAR